IDMAGDSVLAVFDSAASAVNTALDAQGGLEALTAGVPKDRQMRVRVGVHLGDLIEKRDGTVYGNGVNVAARLQALAPVGGIAVSEAVYSAVGKRVRARFTDFGERSVKNIAEPVHVYMATSGASKAGGAQASAVSAGQRAQGPLGRV